jgi:hypothetical protein
MHLTDPNAFIFGGPNEVELWRQSNLDGEQKGDLDLMRGSLSSSASGKWGHYSPLQ